MYSSTERLRFGFAMRSALRNFSFMFGCCFVRVSADMTVLTNMTDAIEETRRE